VAEASRINWPKTARRIRVPLGFVFSIFYIWFAQPTWRFVAYGAIAVIPGLLIRAFASGHVHKNEALATSGPYAYTRNPLYLGSSLIGIGFAIAARSWWIALALVVVFFAIYLPVIRDEEKFLRGQFPEFEDYAKHVPRMLPRLTAYRTGKSESDRFSVELYLKHREWNALLGTLLVMAALACKLLLLGTS
jgi:protein-S-isoprenylcysteine O-methyltransferase Ste14